MNINNYIGLPFKGGGRQTDGLDCWGLARLYYKEELDIDLPSFDQSYHIDDNLRIQELIAQYREGWEKVEIPEKGDLVVFNILGEAIHLGIMIDSTQFLHIRENSDSVVESINSTKWSRRVEGYYRYSPNNSVVLNVAPHPLKTQVITKFVVEGTTLEELYSKISQEYKVSQEISKTAVIMVNGVPVNREHWGSTVLKNSDKVEYRAVAGKEAVRLVALIAVAYFAPQLAVQMLGTTVAGTVGSLTLTGAIASAAITIVGSALINAIAPIRPPSQEDPGSAQQQNLLSGNSNPYNPYGAIPVVLGKIRYAPPLGAKSFVTYPNKDENYLNMMLVWGYGPLSINENTLRIGSVPFTDYDSVQKITLDRKTIPTVEDLKSFDAIYGNDVDQFFKNLELAGPDYVTGTAGTNEELAPFERPLDSNQTTIDGILFNTYTGQPVWPTPPVPDSIYYYDPP